MVTIYKYLPSRYVDAFVRGGQVLFRNLSYFRKAEDAARGDEIEGIHVDDPGHDVSLTNMTSGVTTVGDFRYLHSINHDRVFAFCASLRFDRELFDAFSADACVVIHDADAFFSRCRAAAGRVVPIEVPGLLHGPVHYFEFGKPAPLNVKDPTKLPFVKHEVFKLQHEYRGIFAERGGFAIEQSIIARAFSFREEIAAAREMERLLNVGRLDELVEVKPRP